jgi:serine/threonine protein kinase
MMCPVCGKLGHDGHSYCLYCGASGLDGKLLSDGGKGESPAAVTDDDGKIFDMSDVEGTEWCSTEGLYLAGGRPSAPSRRAGNEFEFDDIHGLEWRYQIGEGAGPGDTPETGAFPPAEPEVAGLAQPENTDGASEAGPMLTIPPSHTIRSHPGNDPDEETLLRTALAGNYTLIRRIGSGGMANVYLARDDSLDREVAVKVLPRIFSGKEEFVTRFRREAQLAARLEHPNIIPIHFIGDGSGLCYFVMSNIRGGSLGDRMKKGVIPSFEDTIRWGADICSALAYAHSHGVIHRDLKPDNIMIDDDGRAVVTDFGIAHAAYGISLTQSGSVMGTPQYMSPDQACGKTLDARSDIYSLGILLYHMTTGGLPFEAGDAVSLMYMHVHTTPDPPETRNPAVPKWLGGVILRCIAKNPGDRYPDTLEVRRALLEKKKPRIPRGLARPRSERSKSGCKQSFIGAAVQMISTAILFRPPEHSDPPDRVVSPDSRRITLSRG